MTGLASIEAVAMEVANDCYRKNAVAGILLSARDRNIGDDRRVLRHRTGRQPAPYNARPGHERRIFLSKPIEDTALQPYRQIFFIAALLSSEPGFAQKLVDPNTVAPEFREAALKRRAEQMRIMDCNKKAEQAKVMPRERAAHVNHCLDAAAAQ